MKINGRFIANNFILFLILILFGLSALFGIKINFLFLLILLEFLLIIIKCKFSFFSIKHMCVNYIALALFYQYNFGSSYGILEYTSMNIMYEKILLSIFIYNYIWLLIFNNSNILDLENRKIKNSNYKLNEFYEVLLCIISVCSVLIAFPRMPFLKVSTISERFSALLPGNAWNHLSIIAMILLFPSLKKKRIVKFVYLFNIFWFISHYERVDVIGLIFGLIFIYVLKSNIKINISKFLKVGLPILALVVAMIITGELRNNKSFDFSVQNITKKILVQSTSADEAYIFNLAIKYNSDNGNMLLKPYISYIFNAVPLLDYDGDITTILKNTYIGHPGGEYLLSAPYMSLGLLGISIFSIVEYIILYFLAKSKSLLSYLWYIFIMCTAFRIVWYGISYIEMGFIYIIPLMILMSKFFHNGIKYEFKEGEY